MFEDALDTVRDARLIVHDLIFELRVDVKLLVRVEVESTSMCLSTLSGD